MALQPQTSANQIASTYMGNPGALQQRMQKDHQANPNVPPDLRQLIAMQDITDAHNAANTQTAMQQPTNPPSIAEALKAKIQAAVQAHMQQQGAAPHGLQALAQQGSPAPQGLQALMQQGQPAPQDMPLGQSAPQGMPQGQPAAAPPMQAPPAQAPVANAAHGGSISDLVSNLGHHYDGGGIVAFAKGGKAKQQALEDAVSYSQNMEDQEQEPNSYFKDGVLSRNFDKSADIYPGGNEGIDDARAKNKQTVFYPNGTAKNLAPEDVLALSNPAPVPRQEGVQDYFTANQPKPAPMDQRALLNQHIAETLGLNRDTERDKGADYFKNTVGLDALLKEMEGRNMAREARHTTAQANRVPEWIKGLQSLGGAPIRGGAGMVLGQLGRGTTAAREAYGAEDEKFADDMDRLRDIITKAKIEGNTGVANAGIAALKELDARKNAAAQTGGSLQIADENATTRKQVAADALAGRRAQLAEGAANRSANLTATQDAHYRELAMKQANATAAKLKDPSKLLTGEDQYPNLTQEELANQLFGKYYDQLKSGKMAAGPSGAASAPPDYDPTKVREVKK